MDPEANITPSDVLKLAVAFIIVGACIFIGASAIRDLVGGA